MTKEQEKEYTANISHKYGIREAGNILVLRIFATWISLLLLWMNAESGKAFFNTLAVFSISQLLYAVSIKANDAIRQIFSFLVILIIAFVGLVALSGLIGAAVIMPTEIGYMIALVRNSNQIYLFRSELFIYTMAIILPIAYTIEWGTGWISNVNFKKISSHHQGGRD